MSLLLCLTILFVFFKGSLECGADFKGADLQQVSIIMLANLICGLNLRHVTSEAFVGLSKFSCTVVLMHYINALYDYALAV